MRLSCVALGVSFFFLGTSAAHADFIARWTFETSQPAGPGPFSPEVGSGAASAFLANPNARFPSAVGDGSAHSFTANDWTMGDYFQFTISTLGERSITVSWDQTASPVGPQSFAFQYSTDGTNFATFNSYTPSNSTWNSKTHVGPTLTFDLSAVTTLDNAPAVYLRLLNTSPSSSPNGPVLPAGFTSVDNFTITASAVPAPSGLLLAGLGAGAVALHACRRRNNRSA
jgi:hypothetical protein